MTDSDEHYDDYFEHYDEPITKRYMIEIMLGEVQDEDAVDAALRAFMPGDLNDPAYRHELIEMVDRAWILRLRKKSRHSAALSITRQDVSQMFADIQAVVGVPY